MKTLIAYDGSEGADTGIDGLQRGGLPAGVTSNESPQPIAVSKSSGLRRLCRMLFGVNHSMQVGSGTLDVQMLVLSGPAFGGKHSAPMDIFKVAVRKFIVPLGVLRLLVVHSQVPAAILPKAMLANELILLLSRGTVLASMHPFRRIQSALQ